VNSIDAAHILRDISAKMGMTILGAEMGLGKTRTSAAAVTANWRAKMKVFYEKVHRYHRTCQKIIESAGKHAKITNARAQEFVALANNRSAHV
jgi:hypothetical protein